MITTETSKSSKQHHTADVMDHPSALPPPRLRPFPPRPGFLQRAERLKERIGAGKSERRGARRGRDRGSPRRSLGQRGGPNRKGGKTPGRRQHLGVLAPASWQSEA